MTQTTEKVFNITKYIGNFKPSNSQYELEEKSTKFFSTTWVNREAVKIEIEMKSRIEGLGEDGYSSRYSTKKMRDMLAQMVFSTKSLSDDRWSAIRAMSLSCRTLTDTQAFQEMRDKSKVYNQREFDYTFAIALYMKLKHPTKFPSINEGTYQRCKSWLRLDYDNLNKIQVSFPLSSASRFSEEIKLYCPWFSIETLEKPELKKQLINYGSLCELLKKTFYGYCPTPQYIGKLGFDSPQKREYSLQDYYLIRAAIIKSQRSRRKPDNYLIFEEF